MLRTTPGRLTFRGKCTFAPDSMSSSTNSIFNPMLRVPLVTSLQRDAILQHWRCRAKAVGGIDRVYWEYLCVLPAGLPKFEILEAL